nr:MAG TPA: hypothetical protein [Caudoviricetes sp.]
MQINEKSYIGWSKGIEPFLMAAWVSYVLPLY